MEKALRLHRAEEDARQAAREAVGRAVAGLGAAQFSTRDIGQLLRLQATACPCMMGELRWKLRERRFTLTRSREGRVPQNIGSGPPPAAASISVG